MSDQLLLGPGTMPTVLGVDLDADFDKSTTASVAAITYDGSSWILKAIKTPLPGIKPLLQSFSFSM